MVSYIKRCNGFPLTQKLILNSDSITGNFFGDLVFKKEKCESCKKRKEKFKGKLFCASQIMMYFAYKFFRMHNNFPSDNQLKSFFLKMRDKKQNEKQKKSN